MKRDGYFPKKKHSIKSHSVWFTSHKVYIPYNLIYSVTLYYKVRNGLESYCYNLKSTLGKEDIPEQVKEKIQPIIEKVDEKNMNNI